MIKMDNLPPSVPEYFCHVKYLTYISLKSVRYPSLCAFEVPGQLIPTGYKGSLTMNKGTTFLRLKPNYTVKEPLNPRGVYSFIFKF